MELAPRHFQINNETIGRYSCMGPNLCCRLKGANQNWGTAEKWLEWGFWRGGGKMMVRCLLEARLINPCCPKNPKKGWRRKGLAARHSNNGCRQALWMPAGTVAWWANGVNARMSKSKGPEMNGVWTIGEGSLRNQQSTANPNYAFGWRGQGGTQTKSRDSLAGETANPNTCSAKEGNWGANECNKFKAERQQELELVFGQ